MDWKSDDRLGVSLARALARALPADPRLRVVSGGEAPENFTGAIRAFAPSHVLLLDAVDHGLEPGTAFLADERSITMGDMTSHRLPLKLLMRFFGRDHPLPGHPGRRAAADPAAGGRAFGARAPDAGAAGRLPGGDAAPARSGR